MHVWTLSQSLPPTLQDVSDRIEKEAPTSPVVQSLEHNAQQVVRRDWMNSIGEELRQGGWGCGRGGWGYGGAGQCTGNVTEACWLLL